MGKTDAQIESDRAMVSFIDEILVYMALGEPAGPGDFPPGYFTGAFGIEADIIGRIASERRIYGMNRDRDILSRIGKIDTSVVFTGTSTLDPKLSEKFFVHMMRGRQLSFSEKQSLKLRGYELNPLGLVVDVVCSYIKRDGTYKTDRDHYVADADVGKWSLVKSPRYRQAQRDGMTTYRNAVPEDWMIYFTEFQHISNTTWSVDFSYPNSPAIKLTTDPSGVREMFRLRDIPEGRTRREALRHWVSGHWRQDRKDSDVEVKVREYLRGQTDFSWYGMKIRINVPRGERIREKRIIEEREYDRFLGRDRRPRDPAALRKRLLSQ